MKTHKLWLILKKLLRRLIFAIWYTNLRFNYFRHLLKDYYYWFLLFLLDKYSFIYIVIININKFIKSENYIYFSTIIKKITTLINFEYLVFKYIYYLNLIQILFFLIIKRILNFIFINFFLIIFEVNLS